MQSAIGFFIAMVIGLTGIGGGTLTTPLLVLFAGAPAATAVGTALVFASAVKFAAAPLYLLRSQVRWQLLGLMLAGGLPGVLAGSHLLSWLEASQLKGVTLAAIGSVVAGSALWNLIRPRRTAGGSPIDRSRLLPWVCVPIGAGAGFSSAGAGSLGSLALLHFTSLSPAQVVGTVVLFGLLVASAGGLVHWSLGNLDAGLLLRLLAGGLPGALLGAHLSALLPARKLRLGLSLWLVYLGSHLLYRGVGLLARG